MVSISTVASRIAFNRRTLSVTQAPNTDRVPYMSSDPYLAGKATEEKLKVVKAPANVGATDRAILAPVTTKPFIVPRWEVGTVLLSARASEAK